jgi:hypothetical protein
MRPTPIIARTLRIGKSDIQQRGKICEKISLDTGVQTVPKWATLGHFQPEKPQVFIDLYRVQIPSGTIKSVVFLGCFRFQVLRCPTRCPNCTFLGSPSASILDISKSSAAEEWMNRP